VRFAGIRPTQTRRSNRCTERQVEVSNQLCLEKIYNNRQNKTIHYVNRQSYNIILFSKCFWKLRHKINKNRIAWRYLYAYNRRHELTSNITRSRCKYTVMSVTKNFIPIKILLFCPPEGRRLYILNNYEICNGSTGD